MIMNQTVDMQKVLGLVRNAVYKGYFAFSDGYYPENFPSLVNNFVDQTVRQIDGGTLAVEMAVVKAYEFGRKSYAELVA